MFGMKVTCMLHSGVDVFVSLNAEHNDATQLKCTHTHANIPNVWQTKLLICMRMEWKWHGEYKSEDMHFAENTIAMLNIN